MMLLTLWKVRKVVGTGRLQHAVKKSSSPRVNHHFLKNGGKIFRGMGNMVESRASDYLVQPKSCPECSW